MVMKYLKLINAQWAKVTHTYEQIILSVFYILTYAVNHIFYIYILAWLSL